MERPSYRAGEGIEDFCRACKIDRQHTVVAADHYGVPLRVVCSYCRSEHNYRGGPRMGRAESAVPPRARPELVDTQPRQPFSIVSDRERSEPPVSVPGHTADLEQLLRRVIREECGVTPLAPAAKWRGGTFALRPGSPGVQEKSWPIETFFHKVVMLRNRLRTLEQHLNASDLPDDVKVKLQGYITGCYGSLTTFNVLFADEDDHFVGSEK